jgi:hypothetical protein
MRVFARISRDRRHRLTTVQRARLLRALTLQCPGSKYVRLNMGGTGSRRGGTVFDREPDLASQGLVEDVSALVSPGGWTGIATACPNAV